MTSDSQITGQIKAFLQPLDEALRNPEKAQARVLKWLLNIYAKTDYGAKYGADRIDSFEAYRRAFPIATYEDYKPIIQRVMAGEVKAMLNEEPLGWAITRGTTGNESKFIPMTPTDIQMRPVAGRTMINYVLGSRDYDLLKGVNLNLNFPSVVGKVKVGEREVEYGYSSGIYVKHVAASTPIRSVPSQPEIDALGGGKTIKDWEARFELAYPRSAKTRR